MPNRLASETSPYLLQHANNPVDWHPWGEEAFRLASESDRPVFLSVGYSSCHWCHVMEHESFEDPEVARLLNENYVCVKVDREERPDVDEAYMAAVQLTSGRGGWPMSVFLTPDRKPFFAGTYFPKEDRGQFPGFKNVLAQLAAAWAGKRPDIQAAADQMAQALSEAFGALPEDTTQRLDPAFVESAVQTLATTFDREHGGFGGAPKFPPHTALEFLTLYALQPWAKDDLREASLGMAVLTLEGMVLGGIHDHVGGGFHRYSTDAEWLLPHFEKMLYDNALMLGNLARLAGLVHSIEPRLAQLFIGAAQGIVDWLQSEMTAPEGWFYSAIDADSEGEEGRFYVWTEQEARTALEGIPNVDAFLQAYGFQPAGNFLDEATGGQTGSNIPHLRQDPQDAFREHLAKLQMARSHRVRPGLDDKALVGWNGLMIGALAEAGMGAMAERAALSILQMEREAGHLPHHVAKGRPGGPGFLEDYACLADGLLKLAAMADLLEQRGEPLATPAAALYAESERLAQLMVDKFYDADAGGFFSTSADHETLFGRTRPVFDQPVPSGNAVALRVLEALGKDALVARTAAAMLPWMARAPQATEALLAACLPLVAPPPIDEPQAPTPAPKIQVKAVEVTVSSREIVADSSGKGILTVTFIIPEGLHLNSPEPPARWLAPTRVDARPVKFEARYPAAQNDQYAGEVQVPVELHLPTGSKEVEFELAVTYQPCTDSECHPPTEKRFDCVLLRG